MLPKVTNRRLAQKIRPAASGLPPNVIKPNGQIDIERIGMPSSWTDLYHRLLTLSWPAFIAIMTGAFLGSNGLFACLYLLQPGAISNVPPGSFWDAFFFSVQTMGTIGYGVMAPQTFYANLLVTLETLVGLLGVALATGLMFARFARPTARVLFSNVAIVKPYNQVPTLMFRMANQRRNQIIEAQLRVSLLLDEVSSEGHFMRRFYDLKLVRSQSQFFTLSWTAMHTIDETSPLVNLSPADLEQQNALMVVSLVGLDETFSQTVHARYTYNTTDILWNWKFVDVFLVGEDNRRFLDYRRFHDVEPLNE